MEIIYTSRFNRVYKKLRIKIKLLAERQELIFRKNPFDHRLRTHKLTGSLEGFWSFSIDYEYRIIFTFGKNDEVFFHLIGNHQVYS
ncbi:type II toxin-antitoxin system mRNA interferase toxin, RelE/StbE family [Candidatus Peregrinibacteria bacterium CG_4_10_14_0_2_um_filter_43_11]|nr:MAG: type II toxin-antitoxin system mRNA interferase toxin, RelE/StbE family [Candidatus Peregrinibacteria bacterium CG_4_10_14_0_2_um_filter_43_11]